MTDAARTRSGLLMGLGAYTLWGVLPLYFKAMATVRPTEIVAHRILWSLVFLGAPSPNACRCLRRRLGAPR